MTLYCGIDLHSNNVVDSIIDEQDQGIKHTNDHTDARFLAHLLRLGILPEGHIYPKDERYIRDSRKTGRRDYFLINLHHSDF